LPDGWITVALLVKARGIRGEVSAENLSQGVERLGKLENARLFGTGGPSDGRAVVVESAWEHGDRVILKFSGIDSMSDAESLAGMELCVPETQRAPVPAGEFYQSDLVGCQVETRDGRKLGAVSGWQSYGGPDLLVVKTPAGKELLVPFARAIVAEVDLVGKRLVVDLPEGLTEL